MRSPNPLESGERSKTAGKAAENETVQQFLRQFRRQPPLGPERRLRQRWQKYWHLGAIAVLTALAIFSLGAPSLPSNVTAAEPAREPIDAEALVRELQTCLGERSQGPNAPESIAALQALSLECLYSTIIVTPEGRIRPDASDRLETLVTHAGLELPAAQSRGSATATLTPLPESDLFSLGVTIQEQSLNFLLDTGASNSLLRETALAQLDLTGTPVPQQLLEYLVVGDECDRLQAQIVNLPVIAVQAAQVFGITGIGLARSPIFAATGADGVLGLDFLQGFDATIDPATRQLHLAPRSDPDPEAIPLEGRLGIMVAAVRVNGRGPYQFLLDTGASRSVISPAVAQSAQIPDGPPMEAQGFCGPEAGRQARLDLLSIEPFIATDLEALVLESEVLQLLGVDGIVGQNFLNRYRQTWKFGPPNALGFPEVGSLELEPLDIEPADLDAPTPAPDAVAP